MQREEGKKGETDKEEGEEEGDYNKQR